MCLDVCTLGERGLVGVLVLVVWSVCDWNARARGFACLFLIAFWSVGPSVLVRARGSDDVFVLLLTVL